MTFLKDNLSLFTTGAETNFQQYGYLAPIFGAVIDGKLEIMEMPMASLEEKENFSKQIERWIAQNKFNEYVMIIEAWSAKVNDAEKIKEWLKTYGSLKEWPDRTEVVMVLYCSPNEEISYTADINRGTISSLGEWRTKTRKIQYNQIELSTRFQGLFLKGKAEQN